MSRDKSPKNKHCTIVQNKNLVLQIGIHHLAELLFTVAAYIQVVFHPLNVKNSNVSL